jgi:hypothetical protein
MARLEQITQGGYQVEFQWECEFETCVLVHHPELQVHPIVEHSPFNTRDGLYGVEQRPCHSIIRYGKVYTFVAYPRYKNTPLVQFSYIYDGASARVILYQPGRSWRR